MYIQSIGDHTSYSLRDGINAELVLSPTAKDGDVVDAADAHSICIT